MQAAGQDSMLQPYQQRLQTAQPPCTTQADQSCAPVQAEKPQDAARNALQNIFQGQKDVLAKYEQGGGDGGGGSGGGGDSGGGGGGDDGPGEPSNWRRAHPTTMPA